MSHCLTFFAKTAEELTSIRDMLKPQFERVMNFDVEPESSGTDLNKYSYVPDPDLSAYKFKLNLLFRESGKETVDRALMKASKAVNYLMREGKLPAFIELPDERPKLEAERNFHLGLVMY